MLVTIATAVDGDEVDPAGVVVAVVFGIDVVVEVVLCISVILATVIVGDTVDVAALVDFSTVVVRDAAGDDGDGVDASVLVVTGLVGVAVPFLVVAVGAFVVLTIVVIDAVDVAALVFFTVIVGESVLFWETMVGVSVVDARIVVWNVFGVTLAVDVTSTE